METAVLETSLKEIKTEILQKIEEHETASGAKSADLERRINDLQRQADAIDTSLANRHVAGIDGGGSLKSLLEQNDDVSRILRDKKGSAIFEIPTALLERKTSI